MGLKIWLPFKKDTMNYGEDPVQATSSSTPVIENDNPNGHCIHYNGYYTHLNTSNIYYKNNFSFATWVYTNYQGSAAEYIFTVGRVDAGDYRGYGLQQVTSTTLNVRIGYTALSIAVSSGSWNHVAVRCNSNNVAEIFVNGTLVKTSSYTPPSGTYSDASGLYLGCFGYASGCIYYSNCYLVDFRIYDHVLSNKEINDLRRNLLLHYPLDDHNETGLVNLYNAPYSEGLTNGGSYSEGNSTYSRELMNIDGETFYRYKINYTGNGSNSWPSLHYPNFSFTAGKTYMWYLKVRTIACSNLAYTARNARMDNDWETGFGTVVQSSYIGQGWKEFYGFRTLQAKSTRSGTEYNTNPCLELYPGSLSGDGVVYTATFDIKDVMICEVDHYVPFIDNRLKLGYISDVAGSHYDGTIVGTPNFNTDTIRGKGCMVFDENTDSVTIPSLYGSGMNVVAMSISLWFKTNTMNNTAPNFFSLGENNFFRARIAGSGNAIWYYCTIGSTSGVQNTVNCKSIIDNVWHHLVITFKNGYIKIYLDGVLILNDNKTSYGTTLKCNSLAWHLAGYIANGENFIGSLCDFRIYGSELTAEDVRELYEVSEIIDNKGNVYGYELIEDSNMKVDKKGIIKNSLFSEISTINGIISGGGYVYATLNGINAILKQGSLIYVPNTMSCANGVTYSGGTYVSTTFTIQPGVYYVDNTYGAIAHTGDTSVTSHNYVKKIADTIEQVNAKFNANSVFGHTLYEI